MKSFWTWRGTRISNLSGTTVPNSSSRLKTQQKTHICSISGKAEIPAKIASTSVGDMGEGVARFFTVLSSSLLKTTSSIKEETRF